MNYYLAIDIGASSGRHIAGWREGGEWITRELHRFPNGAKSENGHLVWDIDALLAEVRRGIETAVAELGRPRSFAIDTWGVDYVLLRGDEPLSPCYAYRDHRTEAVLDEVHARVPFSELYRRTGCQFQPFNTIYQLFADQKAGRLEGVTGLLMIPEYLTWRLTGVKVREYTNATTTGLISAQTGRFDRDVTERLGLPAALFPDPVPPGSPAGTYDGIRAVACASHDTASAVEGIPMEGEAAYLSSGTWSLLGVKTARPITSAASEQANWSNEGGVGYNRYQKNIMGMWLVNSLRNELCPEQPFDAIVREAEESRFNALVDANDAAFLAPESMKAAFDAALPPGPKSTGDYFRCAYRSLALSYKAALDELEHNTGKRLKRLYIVGGGAKNAFLNRLTAEVTGKQVIALPLEATALGNLKIQMEADT